MKKLIFALCAFASLATSCQKDELTGDAVVYAVPSRVTFYNVYGVKSVQVVSERTSQNDLFLFRSTDSTIIKTFKSAVLDSSIVRISTQWETITKAEKLLRLK